MKNLKNFLKVSTIVHTFISVAAFAVNPDQEVEEQQRLRMFLAQRAAQLEKELGDVSQGISDEKMELYTELTLIWDQYNSLEQRFHAFLTEQKEDPVYQLTKQLEKKRTALEELRMQQAPDSVELVEQLFQRCAELQDDIALLEGQLHSLQENSAASSVELKHEDQAGPSASNVLASSTSANAIEQTREDDLSDVCGTIYGGQVPINYMDRLFVAYDAPATGDCGLFSLGRSRQEIVDRLNTVMIQLTGRVHNIASDLLQLLKYPGQMITDEQLALAGAIFNDRVNIYVLGPDNNIIYNATEDLLHELERNGLYPQNEVNISFQETSLGGFNQVQTGHYAVLVDLHDSASSRLLRQAERRWHEMRGDGMHEENSLFVRAMTNQQERERLELELVELYRVARESIRHFH